MHNYQKEKKNRERRKKGRGKYSTIIHITTLEQSCFQSFVLIIVILPVPLVWIFKILTTDFPDKPGPPNDTVGLHANSPTGCRTGRAGLVRIFLLMSSSVTSPCNPAGFTATNGCTTLIGLFFLLPTCNYNKVFIT